jgi:predicted RNA-binding protein (virulence factor B family)
MKKDKDYELPAPGALQAKQPVDLEVLSETELGYKALVDQRYIGLIYHSEISQPLEPGQRLKGWVKGVRPDGKIDLSITLLDKESREALETAILDYLVANGGTVALSDKSPPEMISRLFGCSKSAFKRALGRLKNRQLIFIGSDEIRTITPVRKSSSPWDRKK